MRLRLNAAVHHSDDPITPAGEVEIVGHQEETGAAGAH